MSKLIDAEKLVVDLVRLDGTPASKIGQNLRAIVVNQPDASEPLRKRIAELEGEVNSQEERIQSLERSLLIAKDEHQSCNQAFASLLQIPFYSWQRNWQTVARLVLALPADADVETINLALLLRDQGGQDA